MKPETAPAQPRPNGERQPIPVRVLRFVAPMDALGLSVASSVTDRDRKTGAPSKHRVSYLPWMRHFRIEFDDGKSDGQVSMIHECQVKSWDPAPQE